jgi:hypothetical protein
LGACEDCACDHERRRISRTTNLRPAAEAAPILYHVNIGHPPLDAGARILLESDEVLPRDDARGGVVAATKANG